MAWRVFGSRGVSTITKDLLRNSSSGSADCYGNDKSRQRRFCDRKNPKSTFLCGPVFENRLELGSNALIAPACEARKHDLPRTYGMGKIGISAAQHTLGAETTFPA